MYESYNATHGIITPFSFQDMEFYSSALLIVGRHTWSYARHLLLNDFLPPIFWEKNPGNSLSLHSALRCLLARPSSSGCPCPNGRLLYNKTITYNLYTEVGSFLFHQEFYPSFFSEISTH